MTLTGNEIFMINSNFNLLVSNTLFEFNRIHNPEVGSSSLLPGTKALIIRAFLFPFIVITKNKKSLLLYSLIRN